MLKFWRRGAKRGAALNGVVIRGFLEPLKLVTPCDLEALSALQIAGVYKLQPLSVVPAAPAIWRAESASKSQGLTFPFFFLFFLGAPALAATR